MSEQRNGPVSPADVTPKKRWYWIAAVLAVLGVVLGCGAILLTGKIFSGALPDSGKTFPSGELSSVQFTSTNEQVIYVQLPFDVNSNTSIPPNNTVCTGGPAVTLEKVTEEIMLPDQGANRMWRAVYTATASSTGDHALMCEQSDGEIATYGLGEMPWGGAMLAGVGFFILAIGLPCLCILIALVIVVVVIVKRRSNRKRLEANSTGSTAIDDYLRDNPRDDPRNNPPPPPAI
ncbi:hypothetical protein AB0I28_31510 [Phytomonospora sp. NPDC050363]|uniref:hypothetical protein n=1 Tax=Phytomonospora sp. NPDC050363 TaxID=3155642 RepID=UPI00340D27E5